MPLSCIFPWFNFSIDVCLPTTSRKCINESTYLSYTFWRHVFSWPLSLLLSSPDFHNIISVASETKTYVLICSCLDFAWPWLFPCLDFFSFPIISQFHCVLSRSKSDDDTVSYIWPFRSSPNSPRLRLWRLTVHLAEDFVITLDVYFFCDEN